MPMSLRIPIQKESMIEKAAIKEKKTKTAFVIEAMMKSLDWSKTEKVPCVISRDGFPA